MIRDLTQEQIDLIAHTLGKIGSRRNYFCADKGHDDMKVLLELVKIGLMTKRPAPFTDGSFSDDVIFSVTVGGALAYLETVQARVKELEDFLDKMYKQRDLLQLDGFLDYDDYDQLVKLKEGNDERR
jgi:hypothetical protein